MKAVVVIGHPAAQSFNHALAGRVAQAWRGLGCDVVTHDLTAQGFAPLLTPEEARGQPSRDPLVQRHSADLAQADLLAVIHPVMWGMPPAVVKGWVDRVFALNLAYGFSNDAAEPIGMLPLRSALILNTSNTPPAREMQRFGDPLERIWRDCILGYCSDAKVTRRSFAPLMPSTESVRAAWLQDATDLAKTAFAET